MIFRPPYPFTYDPPIAQSGNPITVNRGRNETGWRDFFLQGNSSHPSSALILTSFGMDAGVPRDSRNRLFTQDGILNVQPVVSYTTFFYSSGVFASALTSSVVKVYVEESDPRGNFVRGMDSTEHLILRQDPWWFSGSQTWSPSVAGLTLTPESRPVDRTIHVRRDHSYRVFIDLYGEIRAAGFGGFGGSGSIAQVAMRVNEVETTFSLI